MQNLDWGAVVSDIASNAVESLASSVHGRKIMSAIASEGTEGLSFSRLKVVAELPPATLTHQLEGLQRGGLVENFLQRRPGSNDYSFYRLTSVGELTLSE